MRELYELEANTCFKVESEEHFNYIKSLMGDKFHFYLKEHESGEVME